MTVPEIVDRVVDFHAKHAVITGGEPMIARGVEELSRRLHEAEMHITIETAGTVFLPVECDLMSISPKLKNSTPEGDWAKQHDKLRIRIDVIRQLMARCDYQLKFVVSRPEDIKEIHAIVSRTQAETGKVILMPEGTDPVRLREKAVWIAELCKAEGFRYGPRLHVDIWGDRRGV